MSATSDRMPLAKAQTLVGLFLALIQVSCLRAEVAGSIRRGKPDIGDLEIVAQTALQHDDVLDARLAELEARGVFIPEMRSDGKPRAWGERYRAGYFKGRRLDLFIVRPDRDWGVTMLIRTGPGEAGQYLVTRRLTQAAPGATPLHLMFRDGSLWRLPSKMDWKLDDVPAGAVRISTPEEADVYAALGMPYVEPADRTIEMYTRLRGTVVPPLNIPQSSAPAEICTGRLNCGDPDALEITIGGLEDGRVSALGAILAPTRSMVSAHKNGALSDADYTARYLELLRWRYATTPQVFLDILSRRRVLTCYCGAGFCHRHLAVDVLEKIAVKHGIPFVRGGEIAGTVPATDVTQPTLFELPAAPSVRYGE